MTTPNLQLSELVSAQSQPEITVNATFRQLDTLTQLSVLSIANSPVGSPADGDRHIVGTSPSGAFTGIPAGAIAYYVAGTFNVWRHMLPNSGWLAYVEALDKYYYYKPMSPGGAWVVTAII